MKFMLSHTTTGISGSLKNSKTFFIVDSFAMAEYTIFSLCTANYKDAYDFAIDSWLEHTDANIVIYSDTTWDSHKRVQIKKVFSKSTDWGTNICRKSDASIKALSEGDNLAFVDMDCYLRGDLGHVFDKSFDLAATKLERKGNVSTGVYFYRSNSNSERFMKRWNGIVKKLAGFGSRKQRPRDQVTFSKAIEELSGKMKIIDVGHSKYNRKISDTTRNTKQIRELVEHNPLVLHFYNKSYLSQRNVREVFEALNVK